MSERSNHRHFYTQLGILGSATRNILFTYIHGCSALVGTVYNFPYSDTREANGSTKSWTAPCSGTFKFEAWGAQGGGGVRSSGGKGAYSSGVIALSKDEAIYIYAGNQLSSTTAAAFNAGSTGGTGEGGSYAGGGASDFRKVSGSWNTTASLASRILIASGGGGGTDYAPGSKAPGASGGYGGSLTGSNGTVSVCYSSSGRSAFSLGASQVSGGLCNGGSTVCSNGKGKFGIGGSSIGDYGGGGGGGYWGGGGGGVDGCRVDSGAGGSSYISGYKGCVAIISASSTSPRKNSSGTTCTESLAASDVSCSYHYSGYIFTDTVMKAGNEVMPAPGGGNETGHSGNGYARITIIN